MLIDILWGKACTELKQRGIKSICSGPDILLNWKLMGTVSNWFVRQRTAGLCTTQTPLPHSLSLSLSLTAGPQIVENCICTLRNLSYRLELEMPPSRLIGGEELDGLLGNESPCKEMDSSCWGRKKKKKKKSLQEDSVSEVLFNRGPEY